MLDYRKTIVWMFVVIGCSLATNVFSGPSAIPDLPNRYPSGLWVGKVATPFSGSNVFENFDNLDVNENLLFRVDGHNLMDTRFSLYIKCRTDTNPQNYTRVFKPHKVQGALLDDNGNVELSNIPVSDGDRNLSLDIKIHLGADGRGNARLVVFPEQDASREFCDSFTVFTLRHTQVR